MISLRKPDGSLASAAPFEATAGALMSAVIVVCEVAVSGSEVWLHMTFAF